MSDPTTAPPVVMAEDGNHRSQPPNHFYYPPPPPASGLKEPKKFYFPMTPVNPNDHQPVVIPPPVDDDHGIYDGYPDDEDEWNGVYEQPDPHHHHLHPHHHHHHHHQVYVLDDEDDDNGAVDQNMMNYGGDPYFTCYEPEEFVVDGTPGDGGYGGLPPPNYQQHGQATTMAPQQQIAIYGNPLVYSLHTIYEESENESSLQTLSSLTSSPMHSGHFNDNDHHHVNNIQQQQQQQQIQISGTGKQPDTMATSSLSSQDGSYQIQMAKALVSTSVDDDTGSQRDGDLDDIVPAPIIDDTLTSKLERYFTSGLLETSDISNNSKQVVSNLETKDAEVEEKIEIQQPSCCAITTFDAIDDIASSLRNFIDRLMMMSDDQGQRSKIEELSRYLDHLSVRHRRDMKRFIVRMIAYHRQYPHRDDDDDEDHHHHHQQQQRRTRVDEDELAGNVIDLLGPSDHDDHHHHRQWRQLQEVTLITFMIDIYSLTQVTHLLFNHRLWNKQHRPLTQSYPSSAAIIKHRTQFNNKSLPAINKKSAAPPPPPLSPKTTTIKVTVNGWCLDPATGNRPPVIVANTNTTTARPPEYHRTILQINTDNNNGIGNDSDNVSVDEINPKLSKFIRSSNPLNRSFLAKMAREPTTEPETNGHTVGGEWPREEPIKPNRTKPAAINGGGKKKQINSSQESSTVSNKTNSSFKNSTLDHLYEILWKNPLSKNKSNKSKQQQTEGLSSRSSSSRNSSKSLSEPNLNGQKEPRKDDPNTSSNSVDSLGEDTGGEIVSMSLENSSKSTPMLTSSNGHNGGTLNDDHGSSRSSWTGSWDKRRRSDRSNGGYNNNNKSRPATSNIKSRLQRSLSGSYTSMASAFNRSNGNNNKINQQQQQSEQTPGSSSHHHHSDHHNGVDDNAADANHQYHQQIDDTRSSIMSRIGKICLSIQQENSIESLTVTILRCQLNRMKKNKTDLYVKVYVLADDHQQQTINTETKTNNNKASKMKTQVRKLKSIDQLPIIYEVEYNEILRFERKWKRDGTGQLAVSLWNNDKFGRNSLLGQTMIRMDQKFWRTSSHTRIWYDLKEPAKIKYDSVPVKGALFLALKFDQPPNRDDPGELSILIKEATDLNLPQYNINGNTYCKLILKPERNKTDDRAKSTAVKMGQCPRWNETFLFKNLIRQDLLNSELEILILWQPEGVARTSSAKTYLGGVHLTDQDEATNEERHVWKQMIDRPNLWAYATVPLRH